MVINRQFEPIPNYTVTRNDDGSLEIETSESRIFYDAQLFSPEGLYIHMEHTGDKQKGNSRGSTRTFDQIEGSTALNPGLISKYGWTVIGRSHTSLIRKTDQIDGESTPFDTWAFPKEGPSQDWFFFGYNKKMAETVKTIPRFKKTIRSGCTIMACKPPSACIRVMGSGRLKNHMSVYPDPPE